MRTRNLVWLARRAAELAGTHIRAARGGALSIETKRSPVDLVTEVDRRSERIIVEALTSGIPGSRVLGEEYGDGGGRPPETEAGEGSDVRWIIDPIDGTHNFVIGRAYYAVSIGVEVAGELVGGAVHDPETRTTYWADRERAGINDAPMPPVDQLRSFGGVNTAVPFQGFAPCGSGLERLIGLLREHGPIRSPGSLALQIVDVALGRASAALELRGAAPWDIAGALAIARAAGCEVVRLEPAAADAAEDFGLWGSDSYLVARSPEVADRLVPGLRAALSEAEDRAPVSLGDAATREANARCEATAREA